MKKILLNTIFFTSLIFSSTESPNVTIIGKSGIYITGTIEKYEGGQIILDSKKGNIGANITIDGGETHLNVKDILLIDYGFKLLYNESDSTTKAELLNLLNQILPEGITNQPNYDSPAKQIRRYKWKCFDLTLGGESCEKKECQAETFTYNHMTNGNYRSSNNHCNRV